MRVVYLHGFASGSSSTKATFIGQRLRARGVEFHAPDLNLPDFSTLTVTRMLEQTKALVDASTEPVTLVGSSLGAFVAVNAAAAWSQRIERLVLLAPALDFGPPRQQHASGAWSPDLIAAWKANGTMPVFHYGYGRFVPIHYGLYEDTQRYDAVHADVRMPVLVFQGRRDDVVDPAMVEEWARERPNVELYLLDDGHQLAQSLPFIWEETARFLRLEP